MTDYLIPVMLLAVCLTALHKQENAYEYLLLGAGEGLSLLVHMLPALILLLAAVRMLRASGALELLTRLVSPLFALLGIPEETALLVLIRPFSGSAALAAGGELMLRYGPDSIIGRTAAIMLGSTETTFYTLSVYFGAAGIRKTRYALPAALIADLTGFTLASVTAKLL